jgi:hypothetical protein
LFHISHPGFLHSREQFLQLKSPETSLIYSISSYSLAIFFIGQDRP